MEIMDMILPSSWFQQRTAVLATMHHKERVMAPILQQALGLQVIIPPDFDTDRFGTFTRDVRRTGSQIDAARAKAMMALQQTGLTMAIASEGSFGAHPQVPLIPCDRELVLLIDQDHQLELVGEMLTTETNYAQATVHSWKEALDFAETTGFPSHGLVVFVETSSSLTPRIIKGIQALDQLQDAVKLALERSPHHTVKLETDMRALCNPTRMRAIAQATDDLVRKLNQLCPQCNYPGFDVVQHRPGLPCSLCHSPTQLTLTAIYRCQACGYQSEARFPNGHVTADPGHCWVCNP